MATRAGIAMRLIAAKASVVLLPLIAARVLAQDSTRIRLPAITVTTTREGPRPSIEVPYAVTTLRPDSLAAVRRASVDELLFGVPGVALANRQNPSQDPRISIRGFGARSTFGVRGVRVLQDGVPLTLPDGQTPVDVVDVENADRVDVIRGSASSLYGNAAGGVIDIRSAPPTDVLSPFARVVTSSSSAPLAAIGAQGTLAGSGFTSSLTRVDGRSFRDYSHIRSTKGALRLFPFVTTDGSTPLAISLRVSDVPLGENPGALTRAQLDANPRQADSSQVRKASGKVVRQSDASIAASHNIREGSLVEGSLFGSVRTLQNPQAFAIVDVDRSSGGATLRFSQHGFASLSAARLSAGVDAQWQNDDRQEYANCVNAACAGGATYRGAIQKDQRELVSSLGPFARAELPIGTRLSASAGVRSDAVRFRLRDRLITATNPDDSGDRTLRAVSPSAGLVYRASLLTSIYASVSSSFETPTTTELGNKTDGSAGLNADLQPQFTNTYEVGARGFTSIGVQWDVAAFEAYARDELVPVDIPNGNGRRYYRNAGRTLRRGAEVGVGITAGLLNVHSAYSFSHFRYVSYTAGTVSYAGRRIPGIPEQVLTTTATARVGRTLLSTTADLAAAADVDDANSVQSPGHAVFGIGASTDVSLSGVRLSPMVALQNIGGVRYAGSLSVNATAGKYYEPAPGRVLLVRVSLARN